MYPSEVMHNVYWGFYGKNYSSVEEFVSEVTAYHTSLNKTWNPNEVVLKSKEVTILFAYWSDKENEEVEEDFDLYADKDYFTASELLFKIHNHVVDKLENDDHHFFEGLTLFADGENSNSHIPYYILNQGS